MFTTREFNLSNVQFDKIKEWANNHDCLARHEAMLSGKTDFASMSCSGGEISVTFTPTAVGTMVSAKCSCGAKINLD